MASKFSARECIPIEYIEEQIEEYAKFDHLRANAEFLDWLIKDYKDNAMANYEWTADTPQTEAPKWTKENCKGCKYNDYPYDDSTCFIKVCIDGNKYEPKQTERKNCTLELFDNDGNYIEPQTDCGWGEAK